MALFVRFYNPFPVLITCLISLFLLNNCTGLRNEVDPGELGVDPPKLVVSCFLSPQDVALTANVTRSRTIVGDSISQYMSGTSVSNATVILSEGGRSVQLLYRNTLFPGDSVRLYYSADAKLLPIIAGHTYKLTVTTADGQKATSACTIPYAVKPTSVKLDSNANAILNRNQNQRYFVRASWQDSAGQTNFYQVSGSFQYVINCSSCSRTDGTSNLSFDDDNRGLFSDEGVDGTTMMSGRAYLTSNQPSGNQDLDFYHRYRIAVVSVNLMTVDQSYYRYREAIIRQNRSRNNPFAEPVLIPSNIDGGLGCFAGYNNSVLSLRLK
ncbi:DUF4249 domain-containing protein [Spirosoma aerolatum]|uniref:DUF4249 domain-containing protein n=1 Tax=Spirosoma aerolatum TaxID=1211326 RepID=UPI0009AD24CC|nr:DUF4249 domain-containing protein [Spirosoma aerolatum]